jgi:hypothetical protein
LAYNSRIRAYTGRIRGVCGLYGRIRAYTGVYGGVCGRMSALGVYTGVYARMPPYSHLQTALKPSSTRSNEQQTPPNHMSNDIYSQLSLGVTRGVCGRMGAYVAYAYEGEQI